MLLVILVVASRGRTLECQLIFPKSRRGSKSRKIRSRLDEEVASQLQAVAMKTRRVAGDISWHFLSSVRQNVNISA